MDQKTLAPGTVKYPALRKLYAESEIAQIDFLIKKLDPKQLAQANDMASTYPDMIRRMLDQKRERLTKEVEGE